MDEEKLAAVRKYWREICMIAMAYTIVFLFRALVVQYEQGKAILEKEIENSAKEMEKKEEETKFWRDAFITTSKYNKYLLNSKDTANYEKDDRGGADY